MRQADAIIFDHWWRWTRPSGGWCWIWVISIIFSNSVFSLLTYLYTVLCQKNVSVCKRLRRFIHRQEPLPRNLMPIERAFRGSFYNNITTFFFSHPNYEFSFEMAVSNIPHLLSSGANTRIRSDLSEDIWIFSRQNMSWLNTTANEYNNQPRGTCNPCIYH